MQHACAKSGPQAAGHSLDRDGCAKPQLQAHPVRSPCHLVGSLLAACQLCLKTGRPPGWRCMRCQNRRRTKWIGRMPPLRWAGGAGRRCCCWRQRQRPAPAQRRHAVRCSRCLPSAAAAGCIQAKQHVHGRGQMQRQSAAMRPQAGDPSRLSRQHTAGSPPGKSSIRRAGPPAPEQSSRCRLRRMPRRS